MRHWIETRLNEIGRSKRELAGALNVLPARITEITKGTRRIQASEIRPLAVFLGIPETAVLANINHTQELHPAKLGAIMVRGAVEAGMWRDAIEWPQSEWYQAPVSGNPEYPRARQFGLEVRGPSMNLIYPSGTILVCVPVEDFHHPITPPKRVIAVRWAINGVEATVKELRQDERGAYWLWPRSDDPRFQTPWECRPPADMTIDDEVRILAIVVGSYRPE